MCGSQLGNNFHAVKVALIPLMQQRRLELIPKYFHKHIPSPRCYLVELGVLHGGQVETGLLALVVQHAIDQLGGHFHVVAVVVVPVAGGAVEQADDGFGVLAVHPGAVAPQLVILCGRKRERAGQGGGEGGQNTIEVGQSGD